MNVTKGRAIRLTALTVASGVLVATGAGVAQAATAQSNLKHKLQGSAQTDVVQLSLNVPLGSTLAGVLPSLGGVDLSKPLTANLIHTDGQLVRNQITGVADAATSSSRLGAGTLFDNGGLLAPVNRVVTASLAKPGTYQSEAALPGSVGPIKIAVPTLRAAAIKNLLSTSGKGQLAGVKVANLADLLPAGALDALNAALAQLIGDANGNGGAVGTITGVVDNLLGQIDTALGNTPVGSVTHTVLTTLQNQIRALQAALPKLIATLENGSVVDLAALDSFHSIATTSGNAVTSKAGVALSKLSLLGGFVTLDAFNNSAVATASGKAHGASAVVNRNLAKVHVGSPVGLDLVLGPDGLAASLLGTSLPAAITSLVKTLVDAVEQVLALAGVKIAAAEYKTTYDKTHSAVSVVGSGLQVLVNLPTQRNNTDVSKALVGVTVGAYNVTAGNFTAAGKTTQGTPVTPKENLPHTGANLPVTAGAALVFLIGAAVLRRRMASTEV
ncbi:MAG: hypothetical protein QOG53_2899 [Frankiales bacterium]|jgi:hypothetical protein|nr:hypothetical protein [Frankiales bacterium]